MRLFETEKIDLLGWGVIDGKVSLRMELLSVMRDLDEKLTRIDRKLSEHGVENFHESKAAAIDILDSDISNLSRTTNIIYSVSDMDCVFRQDVSAVTDKISLIDANEFTTENTIGLCVDVTTETVHNNWHQSYKSGKSYTEELESLKLSDFVGVDRGSVEEIRIKSSFDGVLSTVTKIRHTDTYFSSIFQSGYNALIADWDTISDSEKITYEEYGSLYIPNVQAYERYAGDWKSILSAGFDSFLGIGYLWKAITGTDAITGDILSDAERKNAALCGSAEMVVSVLAAVFASTGVKSFVSLLIAEGASGFMTGVTYESAILSGESELSAAILAFLVGVFSGCALDDLISNSDDFIKKLGKQLGKSSDEMSDVMGGLKRLAADNNFSSVDDMLDAALNNPSRLSAGLYDDIIEAIDGPMKSFDLSGVEDFLVKNHVYNAKTFYEAARKSSDDINLIVKNSELDADDVADVKSYLFEEKHLMPDGTYRRFDASDEVAETWKRLMGENTATKDDILFFNHELTEMHLVKEGIPMDAAHRIASIDYDWSSVSNIDYFAKKCKEIYGGDFYFGAGTSDELVEYVLKNMDGVDSSVDDVIEGGSKAIPNVKNATINPKKLTEYALNPNHPVGGNKAKVFESALGYNQSNADDLMQQIYAQLPNSEAVLGKLDEYGQRYTVDMLITGPNGKTATVRTGWIIKEGSDIPELTTLWVNN